MATFNKGSRQCLGMKSVQLLVARLNAVLTIFCSLAWSELTLMLATMLRKFRISIHDTVESDMEWNDHLFMM